MYLLRLLRSLFTKTICLRVRQYPAPSRAHILRKTCSSHPQDRAQLWNLPLRSQCCWKYVYYFNNHSAWIYDVERCFRVPAYDAVRRLRRKNRSRDQVLRAMIGAIIRLSFRYIYLQFPLHFRVVKHYRLLSILPEDFNADGKQLTKDLKDICALNLKKIEIVKIMHLSFQLHIYKTVYLYFSQIYYINILLKHIN